MIDLIESLNKQFNNKYNFLKLLSVVYEKKQKICTITFLYPYQIEEISEQDKTEIDKYINGLIPLSNIIKIKFKKSFLDEKLIVEDVINFFIENKKGLIPYISPENISSSYNEQDVEINITFNQDVLALIDEFELRTQLKEKLSELYIANFTINLIENEDTLPEKIEAEDIIPTLTKARRYNVNIEKKLVGGDIIPKPEYIKDNTKPKASVILSGLISNKNQKKYVIKKGKRAGEEKSLYSFSLRDESGSVECVYFCPKSHEKTMNAIENDTLIICVGDLKLGINGKLTYYLRKISLASPYIENISQANDNIGVENMIRNHKQIIFPDLLPRSSQSFLFEQKIDYNDFISNNNIVVFDIETTGLDPDTCEITEIGAVKIEKGEITERFSSFARPKNPIPIEVQELTNITNEMVKDAPKIEDVILDFYDWTRGCIISGYNIINFDLKFIKKVTDRLGLPFDNTVVDTYIVAKQSKIHTSNYKLGTVVKALGLTLTGAHRAFNDAYATAQVLMALNCKNSEDNLNKK